VRFGVAVADQPLAPVLVNPIGVRREKPRHLGLDRLHQHLPSPVPQHAQQRVVPDRPSWPGQPDDGSLLHGVSFQR
jgi:hypothetical protein